MTTSTYDLAVVFDHIQDDYEAAVRELSRLEKLRAGPLKRIDLAYLKPSTLVCRLGFDAGFVGTSKLADRLSVAQSRSFRVLDLMSISATDGLGLYERQLAAAVWKRTPCEDLSADLVALKSAIGVGVDREERRSASRTELALPVRFTGGPETAVGLARNISPDGMYIETEVIPPHGTVVWLTLEPLFGSELKQLPAMVVHSVEHQNARENGHVPGFGVSLELNDQQRALFDSFLIATIRGRPWPEKSGRRHGRFRLRLPVEYEFEGQPRQSHTKDISRGGMFILTSDEVPGGTETEITLFSSENGVGVTFDVEVRHCLDDATATRSDGEPGIGVRFLESPTELSEKLDIVLGHVELPTLYRALLIEDDPLFAGVAAGILRRAGYEVLRAMSAADGFEMLVKELFRVDLVIADLHLAGVTDLANRVRSANGTDDIHLALITDHPLTFEERGELLAAGADIIVAKEDAAGQMLKQLESLRNERADSTHGRTS